MAWLRTIWTRTAALFRKRQLEQDLEAELRAHLEMLRDEYVRRGLSPEEARFAALRAFGGIEPMKEAYREQRGLPMLETFLQDLRYGWRQLRRNPGFVVVAVLTLALGIGANTAIFSVVNAAVLRPLPYPQGDRLVWIAEVLPALKAELATGGDYVAWKQQNRTLDQIAAYDTSASFNLTGRGTPSRVHGAYVNASFFATLGVGPQFGRGFTPQEDQPNGRDVVILMHSFWQQYFGSDPNALGKTITLNATPYVVVGVMPAGFRFPGDSDAQMLVPLALNEASEQLHIGRMRLVRIIGRLKPGVALAAAHDDLDAIRKRAQSFPAGGPAMGGPGRAPGAPFRQHFMLGTTGPGPSAAPSNGTDQAFSPSNGPVAQMRFEAPVGGGPQRVFKGPPESELKVVPLAEYLAGNLRPAMLTLLGVVGLVLLIACANVANLMLTRASSRTREVAVRAVLGAGRWRLVRQLLSESLILALAGGAAGLLLAAWGVRLMTRLIPASVAGDILSVVPVRLDARVLLFTLAISIATGVLFGLAPALAATRHDLAERLKEGAESAGPRLQGGYLRQALAVAELSLALVLLIGAGLLIKSFYRVLSIDPGFAPEHVLTMNLSLTDARYPDPGQKREFFTELLRRVELLPGVRSAALADSLPLNPYNIRLMISREVAGAAGIASDSTVMLSRLTVSPAYFYTLGIPVLEGRTFTDADDAHAARVAVVNEALASHLWPNENPIGKQLPVLGEGLTVVGVVGNTRHEGLSTDLTSAFYVPYLQEGGDSMQLAVRATGDPASLISAVRGQVAALDPEQPVYNVTTLPQALSDSVAPRRFNMLLLGIFAGIALALATVGIYGVMASSVTQRTHEFGIRMALGAERRDVLRLVERHALGITLAGVAFGIGGAWGLTRFLASFLYNVRPTDPATFAAVSAALVAVAMLASYLPARRATRVDPVVALRHE